jgi:hypothetical protein
MPEYQASAFAAQGAAHLCGSFATQRLGFHELLRRSKKRLALGCCEGHSVSRRRASAHCFLGRFLPKLRRRHKRRRLFA